MTTIPVDSVRSIEDFGQILLQAQKDLERVRQRIEFLPLDKDLRTAPSAAAPDEDVYASLKDVLDRTESSLRVKAEVVLRSVEDAKLNALPVLGQPSPPGGLPGGLLTASTGLHTGRYQGPPPGHMQPLRRSSSAQRSTHRKQHLRRTALERMQEARTMQLLSQPQGPAGRALLLEKYAQQAADAAGQAQAQSARPRPVDKYGYKHGRLAKGSLAPEARTLPRLYRKDPKLYPRITPTDTSQGVYNLVNRGFIPSFVDVGPAFEAQPAPLQQTKATFHENGEQFNKSANKIQMHSFDLSNLKLDLGSALAKLDHENRPATALVQSQQQQQQQQQQQHQQQQQQQQQETEAIKPLLLEFPAAESEFDDEDEQENDLTQRALEQPRDYDELLDTYSLHQFMIRKGQTLSNTPEFVSFQRKYFFMWGQVRSVIQALERFLTKYTIALAYVNGQRVVELAEEELREPSVKDLLGCLENVDKVGLLMKIPGQRYQGEDAQPAAACKIQATWRMHRQQKRHRLRLEHSAVARVIQDAWRRYATLQRTRERIASNWQTKIEAWQGRWQDWKANWGAFSQKKRVVVHIPSLSYQPYQRQSLHNFTIRQNLQLTRLVDVADPDLDVLYISPFELNAEIQQYYLKLLEVGGVKDATERLKILVPENFDRFPEHFSLAKLVLYSPRLLKRIKEYIRGRPAYLVPCELGPEDLQLAVELDLPLMSADPETAALFGSKSGNKRIFAAAEVPVPPGAHDVFEEDDFYHYFSKLIVDHLDCQKWVLKIDNEWGGRGVASFNPASMRVLAQLRREKAQHSVRWRLPEILATAQARLVTALRDTLPRKVVLACPELHNNSWEEYARSFFRVGGVIEACPAYVVCSPSVSLYVEPDGSVNILNTHDQIFSSPFVYAGASFPSAAPCDLLHTAAKNIGRTCFNERICGYIGVDFVVYFDTAQDQLRLWAVDLNLRMTQSHASFKLYQFLMQGKYHTSCVPRRGITDGTAAKIRYTIGTGEGGPVEQEQQQEERYYTVVNYVYQPNLATLQFGSFFNMCRLKGVAFDLRAKVGTAFMMMDSLASGTLGMLCAGRSQADGLDRLVQALAFLQEQVGLLRLSDHVYAEESNLVALLNATRALLRAKKSDP